MCFHVNNILHQTKNSQFHKKYLILFCYHDEISYFWKMN